MATTEFRFNDLRRKKLLNKLILYGFFAAVLVYFLAHGASMASLFVLVLTVSMAGWAAWKLWRGDVLAVIAEDSVLFAGDFGDKHIQWDEITQMAIAPDENLAILYYRKRDTGKVRNSYIYTQWIEGGAEIFCRMIIDKCPNVPNIYETKDKT